MQVLTKYWRVAVLALLPFSAIAAVTPEEAAQLDGVRLTPWGAEVAGNQEGTIPPYTGGLRTPPPDFVPGSGIYVDPFKDEKPLFTITSENMSEHEDRLPEGAKALLRRYPDFRMDIYPTHRTAAFPEWIMEAMKQNATQARLTEKGVVGAAGGIPFPIPKSGEEAMQNHLMAYVGDQYSFMSNTFYVDQNGRKVVTGYTDVLSSYPYNTEHSDESDTHVIKTLGVATAPVALAGQIFLQFGFLDTSRDGGFETWQYIPGQRRIKRVAPGLTYDTPYPAGGGVVTWDQIYVFDGPTDRFDFKLVGKKEMYLPYNVYKLTASQQTAPNVGRAMEIIGTPRFLDPDYMRWELHRVWVVEAELKPGMRHVYPKRVYYWDEDGFSAGMTDHYDRAGNLASFGMTLPIQLYDKDIPWHRALMHYDFASNVYVPDLLPTAAPIISGADVRPMRKSDWTPEAVSARGTR